MISLTARRPRRLPRGHGVQEAKKVGSAQKLKKLAGDDRPQREHLNAI